jgi:hypothetical protein
MNQKKRRNGKLVEGNAELTIGIKQKKRRIGKLVEGNAELIIGRKLQLALRTKKIRIPKGGYLLQVARGKLKVEAL